MSHAYTFASVPYSLSMLETNEVIREASRIQVHTASARPWVLLLGGKCAAGLDLLQESRVQNAYALRVALLLNPYSVLTFYDLFIYVYVCASLSVRTPHMYTAWGGQKRESYPLHWSSRWL